MVLLSCQRPCGFCQPWHPHNAMLLITDLQRVPSQLTFTSGPDLQLMCCSEEVPNGTTFAIQSSETLSEIIRSTNCHAEKKCSTFLGEIDKLQPLPIGNREHPLQLAVEITICIKRHMVIGTNSHGASSSNFYCISSRADPQYCTRLFP